jgi:hypothetical protein
LSHLVKRPKFGNW